MNWEIIDERGTIFSGTEEEMREQFRLIEVGKCSLEESKGDIKLVQIHGMIR